MLDLKIIKDKYGENMSKLCRELFPTLLETEGLLSSLLLSKFAPSHFLYDDIVSCREYDDDFYGTNIENFRNYIFSLVESKTEKMIIYKKPWELLGEAGYDLYECTSEEEISRFRQYYAPDEELCTFKSGDRLSSHLVFFAVKKNVSEIFRQNFSDPKRQDEYGTSVLSIQFDRRNNFISIKNRYNHRVPNPDATFSNNLDNIIPGLTDSFSQEYNLTINNNLNYFELPNYVLASDNRYYKYNYEINNIYYCPNNIIIDNTKVIQLDKSTKLLLDYFILDLKTKEIMLYDKTINDAFTSEIPEITKIIVLNNYGEKKVIIVPVVGDTIIINLNKYNQIVGYENNNLTVIDDNFLFFNKVIEQLSFQRVEEIKDNFLYLNERTKKLILPKVKKIGNMFLYWNNTLSKIDLPNIVSIGEHFLHFNLMLTSFNLPKAKKIGSFSLYYNRQMLDLSLPLVEEIGDFVLCSNEKIDNIDIAKDATIGVQFLNINPHFQSSFNMVKKKHL